MASFDIPPQSQDRQPGSESELVPPAEHIRAGYTGAGKLKGWRTIVTGGDSGIGRAAALHFAREGADVAILYLDEDQDAEATAALIEAEGVRCMTIKGDLRDSAFAKDAADRVAAEWGGIDVLVNNAGIQVPRATLADVSDDEWQWHFDVNINGYFYLARAALAQWPRARP